MRQRKNVYFTGTRVKSITTTHSKFTHKQRFAMDVIAEKLNKQLLVNKKLHLIKKPYTREDVIQLLEKLLQKKNITDYDKGIELLNKELKEKNFDIYKS